MGTAGIAAKITAARAAIVPALVAISVNKRLRQTDATSRTITAAAPIIQNGDNAFKSTSVMAVLQWKKRLVRIF